MINIQRSPSSNNIFAFIFKWTNNFSLIAPTFITFVCSDKYFSIVSILALKFATIWWSCGALLSFQIQTTFCNLKNFNLIKNFRKLFSKIFTLCNGRISTCHQTVITSTIVAAVFDTCSEIMSLIKKIYRYFFFRHKFCYVLNPES